MAFVYKSVMRVDDFRGMVDTKIDESIEKTE
jgi:hypothetical protein